MNEIVKVENQVIERNENVQVFSNKIFGSLQVFVINNEPWFLVKDVAEALGYPQTATLTRRLDDDEKGVQILHTLGGAQELVVINESGLYSSV